MGVSRLLKAPLLALAGLFAPAAAAQPAAPPAPRPAIWVIEDADTRIYLFGTVHVFPASLRWRSAALDRVIAEADELVMETPEAVSDDIDENRLTAPMRLGKSLPILQRVSPRARGPLQAALNATGVPLSTYDQMTTWGVAFLLSGAQMRQPDAQSGASGSATEAFTGAEDVLGTLFRKARKPISGVETIEDQIHVFASLPLDGQRRFLESVVLGDDDGTPAEAPDESWVAGDVDGIAAEMNTMPPDLYQAVLTRRNRNWTEWLARRLERPGTVLFAVGAGHLAGPDSVQRMLAERGIVARRIN
jgi:uncharacterized protein